MFTRTMGHPRRAGLVRRLLQRQRKPACQPGIVIDGVTIYPAECCTEQQQDQERDLANVKLIAAHFAGGLALFSLVSTIGVHFLRAAIQSIP